MSKTKKANNRRYDKDTSQDRRRLNREYRNKIKQLIRISKFDTIHKPSKSSGWESW